MLIKIKLKDYSAKVKKNDQSWGSDEQQLYLDQEIF